MTSPALRQNLAWNRIRSKHWTYKLAGSSAKRERLFNAEQHANLDAH